MDRSIIDPPRFAARLKEGGIASEHAEAIAKAIGEELAHARPRAHDDPERRGTLIGEVRVLKWAVGLAFVLLASAFYAMYEFQYMTFQKASLAVANQAAARERTEAVRETISTLDENTGRWLASLTARTDDRFEAVDQRFEAVDQRFEAVDHRFDHVDQRFDTIEALLRELLRSRRGENEGPSPG